MEMERKDKNVKKSLACIHMCSNDHTNAKKWLITKSCDATHVHGGILDLIFDTSNSKTVCSLLSPYSDHFLSKSDALYTEILTINNLALNSHYITHQYLCWYLGERVSENLEWSQSPKEGDLFMFSLKCNKGEITNSFRSCVALHLKWLTCTNLKIKGSF